MGTPDHVIALADDILPGFLGHVRIRNTGHVEQIAKLECFGLHCDINPCRFFQRDFFQTIEFNGRALSFEAHRLGPRCAVADLNGRKTRCSYPHWQWLAVEDNVGKRAFARAEFAHQHKAGLGELIWLSSVDVLVFRHCVSPSRWI